MANFNYDYEAAKKEVASYLIPDLTMQTIYSFDKSHPFFDDYQYYYQNCQHFLATDSLDELTSAKVLFNRDTLVDAMAIKDGGHYLIVVSTALMNVMKTFFIRASKKILDSKEIADYGSVTHYFNEELGDFMKEVVYRFVFFHERAHLIQFKEKERSKFKENRQGNGQNGFVEEEHVCEIDADLDAARKIYASIRLSFLEMPKDQQTKDHFFKILCLTISAVLIFFYRTHNMFEGIYYKEKDHPHHATRIGYILHHFMQQVQNDPAMEFTFEPQEIYTQLHRICKIATEFDPDEMRLYAEDYFIGMQSYMEEMMIASEKYPYLILERFFPIKRHK